MNILVTGASGFIGQHLVNALLQAGHTPLILDLNPFPNETYLHAYSIPPQFIGDIRDKAFLNNINLTLRQSWGKIDCCVHLAAVAAPRLAQTYPDLAWSTNVMGTRNVLELCRDLSCGKVVFFSSAHVYGISPKYLPTDENHPLALLDTYTTTKIVGEQLCRLYFENYKIGYTCLRLFNAYGPGQSDQYFIGKKILEGKNGKVTIMNAEVTKDWVSVHDVIKATLRAIHSGYVGAVNIGTGIETTLLKIAVKITEFYGISPPTPDTTKDDSPTRMACDRTLAAKTLGWEPSVSFDDGLKELLEKSR